MSQWFKDFFVRSSFRTRKENDEIISKSKQLTEEQITKGQSLHHLRQKGQLADAFSCGVKWAESMHGIRPPIVPIKPCLHFWSVPVKRAEMGAVCLICDEPFPKPSDNELLTQLEKHDNQSKP